MEYVYASLLLHDAKKELSEKSVTQVLEAAGVKVDSSRVKALLASLKDVNIDEAIKKASAAPVAAAAPAPQGGEKQEGKKEEKSAEEEEKAEEAAAEGLGSLFG